MRILISCGEPSGDLYAAALASEILRRQPTAEIAGLGGPRLQAAGARLVGNFAGLSVTGLTEALGVVPRSYAMLRRLVREADARRPDVFVAVDFPDFNFRLMAAMRRRGIPVVYYVGPQLWAWRPARMQQMQAHVDRVLVIFPFEAAIYERAHVPVTFVGHPLLDLVRVQESRERLLTRLGLTAAAPTVALLPGSRRNEVHRIAPAMAGAVPLIRQSVPTVQFIVARAPGLPEALFAPLLRSAGVGGAVVSVTDQADDVLAASDLALTASGTATVQTALHACPMVVAYRLSPMSYRLGRRFVLVDTFAMPNLVAGRPVVPELIQDACTPERLAAEAVTLLTNGEARARMTEGLRDVRERLGGPGASARAADAVLSVAAAGRGRSHG
ncbi:MAG: lipid-A-disaccharide synthase [Vicinamibacterales bacterium]